MVIVFQDLRFDKPPIVVLSLAIWYTVPLILPMCEGARHGVPTRPGYTSARTTVFADTFLARGTEEV